MLKHIDAGLATMPVYFIALDMVAYLRDESDEFLNVRAVREVLLKKQRAQMTPVVAEWCGHEYAVLKKYGAADPPEDWEYRGGRVEA